MLRVESSLRHVAGGAPPAKVARGHCSPTDCVCLDGMGFCRGSGGVFLVAVERVAVDDDKSLPPEAEVRTWSCQEGTPGASPSHLPLLTGASRRLACDSWWFLNVYLNQ